MEPSHLYSTGRGRFGATVAVALALGLTGCTTATISTAAPPNLAPVESSAPRSPRATPPVETPYPASASAQPPQETPFATALAAGPAPSLPPVAQPDERLQAPIPVSVPVQGVATPVGRWSGYIVGKGPYTAVEGTFTVPNLAVPTLTKTVADVWVGIGGVLPDTSLIQAGVTEATAPGKTSVTYQAWWEVLPDDPTTVPIPWSQVSVWPGHQVTVVIGQIDSLSWRITLTDDTTGQRFTTDQTFSGPQTSAEWIVEAPFDPTAGSIFTLGHYVPDVSFSNARFSGPVSNVLPWWFSQGSGITSVPYPLTSTGFTVGYGVPPPAGS